MKQVFCDKTCQLNLKKLENLKQNETISDFTYNEDLKSAQNAGNCICGVSKIQKFSRGACPRTPLVGMSLCDMLCGIAPIKTLSHLLIHNQPPTFKSNDNPDTTVTSSSFLSSSFVCSGFSSCDLV